VSDNTSDVADRSDIVVDRPIAREVLRAVESGYLVTCTDISQCDWQGLFPDPHLAATAAERHYDRDHATWGPTYSGHKTYTVVELVDRATAYTVEQSSLGLSVEEIRMGTQDNDVREFEFPRTTGDVSEVVERGDRIELPPERRYKVASVTETRSHGLPTWTVAFVEEDVDLMSASRSDYKWKNEQIARDDEAYTSYGPEPLAAPSFEVVGETEHQADFSDFGGGASA